MVDPGLADAVRAVGLAAGLDRVGFASPEPFAAARVALVERKAAGLHGGMQFTYRNPARATDPAQALPSVRSLVVAARAYPAAPADPDDALRARGPLARVANYATADHYTALRNGLDAVADRLRSDGWTARVLLDDNALVDRAAAHRAGIGWFGKNGNILVEGLGSWFVLGSVLTDAPLVGADDRAGESPMAEGCGSCTRCLTGCPTGAIVAPGVVDARRCLAWLVQAEGVFPLDHRDALGDRIYGCDVCQEVCPPSARTAKRDQPVDLGGVSAAPGPWVAVLDMLRATDDELLDAYGRWYIPRRDPRYLRRNALIVLGNAATVPVDDEVRAVVERHLRHPDPLLRAHAVWAARRLGVPVAASLERDGPESDPLVLAELAADVVERAGSFVS